MFFFIIIFLIPVIGLFFVQLEQNQVNSFIHVFFLISIGLIGGLRFEVGADWQAYKFYFENVDIDTPPLEEYFGSLANLQFEIGYFLVNYFAKKNGWDYQIVFLLSSLFVAYSVYHFTRSLEGNKLYVIINYMSYAFLILHFAQVRQSISVGFFLLGCSAYLKNKKIVSALLICFIGLLFQYSSIAYILLMICVIYIPNEKKYYMMFILILIVVYLNSTFLNFYTFLKIISPESLSRKIEIYEQIENMAESVSGQSILGVYILCSVTYLITFFKALKGWVHEFIYRYTLYSLILTAILIYMFPTNYVMFSRIYIIATIFQGYTISLLLRHDSLLLHRIYSFVTIGVGLIFYLRILLINQEYYTPYRSILGF